MQELGGLVGLEGLEEKGEYQLLSLKSDSGLGILRMNLFVFTLFYRATEHVVPLALLT